MVSHVFLHLMVMCSPEDSARALLFETPRPSLLRAQRGNLFLGVFLSFFWEESVELSVPLGSSALINTVDGPCTRARGQCTPGLPSLC